MILKVEFMAGTDIDEACKEMCGFADFAGCTIEANFNGVHVWANRGDNSKDLVRAYRRELSSDAPYKLATARGGK